MVQVLVEEAEGEREGRGRQTDHKGFTPAGLVHHQRPKEIRELTSMSNAPGNSPIGLEDLRIVPVRWAAKHTVLVSVDRAQG